MDVCENGRGLVTPSQWRRRGFEEALDKGLEEGGACVARVTGSLVVLSSCLKITISCAETHKLCTINLSDSLLSRLSDNSLSCSPKDGERDKKIPRAHWPVSLAKLNQSERFAFLAEWYDPNASLLRRYELLFYPADGSVEMHDVKNRRTFLKRTKYEDLRLEDLFIGNKVNVFSRQLVLVDYGDQYTARQLGSRKEKTLALIKPDAVSKAGEIIDMINKSGFTITKLRMMTLSSELIQFITSGPVIAMEILRDDAICEWKRLLGPANSGLARTDAPGSIRALFGTDGIRNAAHGPDSFASAAREMELFFPSSGGCGPANTAKFTNCTCCIVKPHAISEGLLGKILIAIRDACFEISAMQMFNMDRVNVEEFYEVYKGVVPEYNDMVTEMCSGSCVAMEIQQNNPTKTFREFCGPSDPEIARHLRPETLRAIFGKTKMQNAVHCTDLPEDGLLEPNTSDASSTPLSSTAVSLVI
ncbi:Nucleoside diphosphate kinase 7 [Microtus ochrogaster]|uniref:Nucleoside diphosphate kinase homolog 7 n=1 Tax=Microtus ochrogaster TaxID=79684 RepID=A0A8J6KR43_MICOH|nr:Nucleoside diphosphate kinase 7 [Microtus ochrogaster]